MTKKKNKYFTELEPAQYQEDSELIRIPCLIGRCLNNDLAGMFLEDAVKAEPTDPNSMVYLELTQICVDYYW